MMAPRMWPPSKGRSGNRFSRNRHVEAREQLQEQQQLVRAGRLGRQDLAAEPACSDDAHRGVLCAGLTFEDRPEQRRNAAGGGDDRVTGLHDEVACQADRTADQFPLVLGGRFDTQEAALLGADEVWARRLNASESPTDAFASFWAVGS